MSERERGREKESDADGALSTEPDMELDPTATKSWAELKPRYGLLPY